MSQIKLFEVRDRGTFLPCMAIQLSCAVNKLGGYNEDERYLLSRAGFGKTYHQQEKYVLLNILGENNIFYETHVWTNRTRLIAHEYIRDHWDELESGQVIDVEYILGETDAPKVSESLTSPY